MVDVPDPDGNNVGNIVSPSTREDVDEADAIALALKSLTKKGGLNAQQVTDIVQQEIARLPKPDTKLDEKRVREIATEVASKHVNRVQLVDTKGENMGKPIENAHAFFSVAIHIINAGIPLLMYGEKGTGKTTLAAQLAKALGRHFGHISCNGAMTAGKLVGFANPVNGTWMRGELTTHMDKPAIVLIDEVDASDPGVQLSLNSVAANRYIGEPTGVLHAHPDFVLVAACNTINGATRSYNGRNKMDDAFLDRFAVLELLLDNAVEASLCGVVEASKLDGSPARGGFTTQERWLSDCRAVRSALKKAQIPNTPSPRAGEYGTKLLSSLGEYWLRELFLYRGCSEDVRAIIHKTLNETF